MRTLISLFTLFLFSVAASAQDQNSVKNQINAIKMQENKYLYAEAVNSDKNTAYHNAQTLLEVNIEEWARQNNMSDVSGLITTCTDHILKLETMRGRQFLAFVYVEKSKILPYKDEKRIVVVPMESAKEENNIPVANASKDGTVELNLSGNNPQSSSLNPQSSSLNPKPSSTTRPTLTNLEKEMLTVTTLAGIKEFLGEKWKKNEDGFEYDTHKNMPADVYMDMFIYDRDGVVKAYLRRDNNQYYNIGGDGGRTTLDAYKGCGLIWFREK